MRNQSALGSATRRRLGLALALAALASFLIAPSPVTQQELWKQSLAQIDEALETNPAEVSEDSLNSCRAMRRTAVLLYKMGHHARAFRRLKSCRNLLKLDWPPTGDARPARLSWIG